MKQRTVVWKALKYEGLEHLRFGTAEKFIQAESVVLGVEAAGAFRLDYRLHCDASFHVLNVDVSIAGGNRQILTSDGKGNWWGQEARTQMHQFAGCIDIDLTATPFTNSLPIRRIDWQAGQSEDFRMLYIAVPELTLSVSRQRYTCLEKTAQGSLFRFELIDGDFEALLPVDPDGLVIDYPGLFRRLGAG